MRAALALLAPPTPPTRCDAPGCRKRLPERDGPGRWRRYCGATCRSLARRKRARESRSRSVEWYTPEWVLRLALEALVKRGQPCPGFMFDLDPCAAIEAPALLYARAHVMAARGEDGLAVPWPGIVWCNPPYGPGELARWTAKAGDEVIAGRASVVVLLVPLRPSSGWWRRLRTRDGLEVETMALERRVNFLEHGREAGSSARFETALLFVRRTP